jgi:DNA-binding SARP family transcriptional activator
MEIRLLGELEVIRDGRAAALPPSKKTRALLAYLVATNEPHPRARLCDLLWDGPDDPRAGLRWSLSKLRSLFDGNRRRDRVERAGPIVASAERVAFAGDAGRIDLLEHRADVSGSLDVLGLDRLKLAAARFRGDFLEGLDLPECYRFHEWCTAERETLRRQRVAVLSKLVDRLSDSPEEALAHARAWVQIEPIAEAAHVALVRTLGLLGRRREALQQYERCRHILEIELRTKPSASLEAARVALETPTRESGRSVTEGAAESPEALPAPVAHFPSNAPRAGGRRTDFRSARSVGAGAHRQSLRSRDGASVRAVDGRAALGAAR